MFINLQRKPLWKLITGDLLLIITILAIFAYFQMFRPTPYESVAQNDGLDPDNSGGYSSASDAYGDAVSESDGAAGHYMVDESRFSEKVVSTDNLYTSRNVSITLSDGVFSDAKEKRKAVYHLLDIYVRDVKSVRTVLAQDMYGYGITESAMRMAKRSDAICAINGDYYGMFKKSLIIRNGILYGEVPKSKDICVLYENGEMVIHDSEVFNAKEAMEKGAWQAWSFGPSLLDRNGAALTEFKNSAAINGKNPRSVIGYYEPGHYCFLAVDGRSGDSAGLTMDRLAQLCGELGMTCAYNLDGGQTSVMTFGKQYANEPYHKGRPSSDIICVIDPEQ